MSVEQKTKGTITLLCRRYFSGVCGDDLQVPFSVCFTAFQNSMTARLITRRTEDAKHVLRWYLPASTWARHSNAWILTVNRTSSASHAFTRILTTDFLFEIVNNISRLNLYHCGTAFLMGASRQSSYASIRSFTVAGICGMDRCLMVSV